ncbi:murein transglycosylase A [Lichenifustis flavocetrariae]|uniref:peptidoglycan lytic exotransglycosylase n=1 Tax=Lichenifustis flavocetrariae TaxID=2949735 RepID=A0AA41YX45_9HYPH|nr:MltA domain-containing protein [Lichenifustis flavocetrariae]MCW6510191.1 MltA domain-containing protein [Lichenifustis flavocetrariae]
MRPAAWMDAAALQPLAWEHLDGWQTAAHASVWAAFRASGLHIRGHGGELRAAAPPWPALRDLCDRAAFPQTVSDPEAKVFFEQAFVPFRVVPEAGPDGFLTGYYEPVIDGALQQSAHFTAPILPPPERTLSPTPDRAAFEAFALSPEARPVVWLRDWTEVFLVQVQGSARVRLPDGTERRLVYAGRNGLPYTSIGRRLIETGRIALEEMSLDVLKAWLRAHGQEVGQEARALMQENRSYIFFRLEPGQADERGPTGGQGLPLEAGVSIAVDRNLWCYGLPFWIESDRPIPGFGPSPLARLFIAQDTGSAILGRARADLFTGSGEAAGTAAGLVRHPARFTVLLPRAS